MGYSVAKLRAETNFASHEAASTVAPILANHKVIMSYMTNRAVLGDCAARIDRPGEVMWSAVRLASSLLVLFFAPSFLMRGLMPEKGCRLLGLGGRLRAGW